MSTTNRNGPRQRPTLPRLTPLAAALCSLGLLSLAAYAGPQGGVMRAGSATIAQSGANTRIDQTSERAVIDWRAFGVGADEAVRFNQPSRSSATLNRVTGEQLSVILGRIDANGQVVLVNPNGIVFGAGAQVNVGSLIASTANLSNADFMAGRMVFDQPGKPGAGIANAGALSAAEGGLIALVAPHVRNDGLIQARLGRVVLGSGDTFTLDLYGDGLVNLAFAQDHANALLDATGRPVGSLIAQAGKIAADGGQVVLISAPAAKAVLDQVINLSGIIQADTVAQQDGRIVLLGRGGAVAVSGTLSAQGSQAGQAGGTIEVLGDAVRLAAGAQVNASGAAGGGTIHVGGAFQGQGTTYRAQTSTVDAGAQLRADATAAGNGGEVIVWADGRTTYAGDISARGGSAAGDGGRVEVSGKQSLEFLGMVDAGAARGASGSLLLDPATFDIGLAEAGLISRVLRTGTSTAVAAGADINVNAIIDGRGRNAGGGLTLSAGNDINVNEFIVTHNGAINLLAAAGTVNVAAGKAVFAGSAPISVRTGGNLSTRPMITGGALSFASTGGSVSMDTPIDTGIGPVTVHAAQDVSINQPVVNLRNGSGFGVSAGGNVAVNAQIDGRGGNPGGAIDLSAGGSVLINDFVVANFGALRARAINGSIVTAAGKGLFADGGAIDLSSGADFATGILSTTGPISLRSSAGSVTIAQGIDATVGAVTIASALDANLNTDILNLRSGAPLTVSAGQDIHVRARVDGQGGAAGGAATLSAGRNVDIQQDIVTNQGAIRVTAGGSVIQPTDRQLRSGSAPISVSAGGDLITSSYVTGGALDIRSTAGAVTVAEPIYDTTGTTTIRAGTDVNVNQRVENVRTLASLGIRAGRDLNVNAQIGQDRDATTDTGPIALTAGRDVIVNQDVVSRSATLTVEGTSGTVRVAAGKQLRSGSGTLTVRAGSDLFVGDPLAAKPNADTPYITSGTLNVSSTAGTLFIEAPIPDSTGPVNLLGGNAVQVNERIYSNNHNISITAGAGGIVMSGATIEVPNTEPSPATVTITLSDTDARLGNLTLLAMGDITAPSVRSAGTLSITSTGGRILSGRVVESRVGGGRMPQHVLLAAAQGINAFDTRTSPDVEARSSAGSVNLSVFAPQRLFIDAALDVRTGGFIGSAAELVAGRDVILNGIDDANLVRANAGHDFLLNGTVIAGALKAVAGHDVRLATAPETLTWIEGPGGTMTLKNPAAFGTVETIRGLTLSAGNDVVIVQPVHVSDSLSTGTEAALQPSTLTAGRNVDLSGELETIGPVNISATSGSITVSDPIGAPVPVLTPVHDLWNPFSLGVASLSLSAPGAEAVIDLQGARAEGSIAISAPNGSVISAFALSAPSVSVTAPSQSLSATPIAQVARLIRPTVVAPAIAPGPSRAAPDGPQIPAAPPPAAPALPEISVSLPEGVSAEALAAPAAGAEATGDSAAAQAAAQAAALTEILPGEAGGSEDAADGHGAPADAVLLVFTGGRGVAQTADLGRGGTIGSIPDVFLATQPADDERHQRLRRK